MARTPMMAVPYVGGSDTSKEAAEKMEPHLGRLQGDVLSHIRSCADYGATDDEIEIHLQLSHQTASARRRELVLADLIEDSGDRRRTRSNRKATVWIAK